MWREWRMWTVWSLWSHQEVKLVRNMCWNGDKLEREREEINRSGKTSTPCASSEERKEDQYAHVEQARKGEVGENARWKLLWCQLDLHWNPFSLWSPSSLFKSIPKKVVHNLIAPWMLISSSCGGRILRSGSLTDSSRTQTGTRYIVRREIFMSSPGSVWIGIIKFFTGCRKYWS